jgi:hypothetical protein
MDTMCFEGATTLSNRIKAFWGKRGVTVTTWLESQTDAKSGDRIYVVRSNLDMALQKGRAT